MVPVEADHPELIRRDVLASKAQHVFTLNFILYRTHKMHNWLSMTAICQEGHACGIAPLFVCGAHIKTERNHNFRVEQKQVAQLT